MPDPPIRQIFLPNYKVNISVPADYSDEQVAAAIQRNKAAIQARSPVFAQGQAILNQGLAEQGITEQQARQQGIPNAAANAVIAANQSRDAQNLALQGRIASLSNVQSLMQRGQLPTDYDATYLDQKANLANVAKQLADLNAQQQRLGSLTPIDQLNRMAGAGARSLLPGLLSTDPVMEQKLNALPSLGAMASASPPGGYGETMIPGVEKQLYDTPGYWGGLQRGAYAATAPTNLGLMAALPFTGLGSALAPLFAAQNVYGAASALSDMDTLHNRGLGAYLGQATVPLAFAGLGAYDLARGLGGGDGPVQDGVNAVDPSAPLLLPPGPDPNVYEAEFRPNTPTAPVSSDLALASGRAASLPQITSGFPAAEGFGADPTGNLMRATLGAMVPKSFGPEIPTSYGQELIPLPTDQGSPRYSSPVDYGAPDFETQNGALVRSRPSVPMLPDSAISLPSAAAPVASPASIALGQPVNSPSIQADLTTVQPVGLSPTAQKRALLDALQGKVGNGLALAPGNSSTDALSAGGYGLRPYEVQGVADAQGVMDAPVQTPAVQGASPGFVPVSMVSDPQSSPGGIQHVNPVPSEAPVATSALSSSPPSIVAPLDLPSIPLKMYDTDANAISALLEKEDPFTERLKQPFAVEITSAANIPFTAQELVRLRNLAEKTKNVPGAGKDKKIVSYNKSTLINRIDKASQSFPATSGTSTLLPQTSEAATGLGQPVNSPTVQGDLTSVQPVPLTPTAKKRAQLDALQGQVSNGLALAPGTSRTSTSSAGRSGREPYVVANLADAQEVTAAPVQDPAVQRTSAEFTPVSSFSDPQSSPGGIQNVDQVPSEAPVATSALSSAPPSVVAPPEPPSVPLSMYRCDAEAISAVAGKADPFTEVLEQAFAGITSHANIPFTAQELVRLRKLANMTPKVSGEGKHSYKKASLIVRINKASKRFSKTGELIPQIPKPATGVTPLPNRGIIFVKTNPERDLPDAISVLHEQAVEKGGKGFQTFDKHTYSMDDLTWGNLATLFTSGYSLYSVRDVNSGEILKVGHTSYVRWRFPPYRVRALKEGRTIAIDVIEVDERSARAAKPTLESQVQRHLWQQGNDLPWDKSRILRNLRKAGR